MYTEEISLYKKYSTFIDSDDFKRYKELYFKFQKSIINIEGEYFLLETKTGKILTHLITICVILMIFFPTLELDKLVISFKTLIVLVPILFIFYIIYFTFYLLSLLGTTIIFFLIIKPITGGIIKRTKDFKKYIHLRELLHPKFEELKKDTFLYINSTSKSIIEKIKKSESTSSEYLQLKKEFVNNYNFIDENSEFINVMKWSFLRESKEIIKNDFDFTKIENEKEKVSHSNLLNKYERTSPQVSFLKNKYSVSPKKSKRLPISKRFDNEIQNDIVENRKTTTKNEEKNRRQKVSKTNFENLNKLRQEIGLIGEEFILSIEIEKLKKLNLLTLIPQIEHTSKVQGDGLGFDCKSSAKSELVVF